MSNFYTELANYYEDIFPVKDAQIELLTETVEQPPKDILDVACGTGGYSKLLSKQGYNLTSVDLNEEMIKKLTENDYRIDAQVLNMLEIEKLDQTFDLIFCIGNSLVHLNNHVEIAQFLNASYSCLNKGGKLLIQIVNYDRILAKNITSLPTINNYNKNLSFERNYDYIASENKINFKTQLIVDEKTYMNQIKLIPLKSPELLSLLRDSGFSNFKMYGQFNKETYQPMDSFALIIIAEKI